MALVVVPSASHAWIFSSHPQPTVVMVAAGTFHVPSAKLSQLHSEAAKLWSIFFCVSLPMASCRPCATGESGSIAQRTLRYQSDSRRGGCLHFFVRGG